MRRTNVVQVAAGAIVGLAVLLVASVAPVVAAPPAPDDLPSGFVDGIPVGGDDRASATAPDASSSASTGQRYVGRLPWQAIQAAAAATARTCGVSDAGLTALAVAPIFKESSAATTPSSAPSPMTLSRYDEWSGVRADDTNRNANYGLYAFRDPQTSYRRAFWHPGIGIWQYDSAGVGAPYTAIERMDVGVVAADVAAGMAARYCSPSTTVVGHGPPFSDLERRYSAWAPWGYPCTACELEFQSMVASSPAFASVTLVEGISLTGGAVARSCALPDVGSPLPCWYVDPSVGVIEGATAWATIDPTGGSPTVAPTPLALPFYVVDRGTHEERHWLRADTGYAIDISGRRQIGRNARPRSNQPGSGIEWSATSGLCDRTEGRGSCDGVVTADGAWVHAAIQDFLGRPATPTEVAQLTARLEAGTSRSVIARELSTSPEWVRAVVRRFYLDTLGREPDPGGLAHWTAQIAGGHRTVAQVAALFYSSAEYYRTRGGGTDPSWVTDLYRALLGREPDAAGLAHWVGRTAREGRERVAGEIYGSAESRRDRVRGLFQVLLGRDPDPSGLAHWSGRIATTGDLELAVSLAISAEYGRRAGERYP